MLNEKLCEQIKSGDTLAFEKLYNNNISLLYSLINRFYFKIEEKEDILSCAKIGLFNAAKNFDSKFNCQFSTYAVPIILGEIKQYFRSSMIHVSRGVKDTYRAIVLAQEELESKLSRKVTLNDISNYLNMPLEDIVFAYESNAQIISLDQSINEEDDVCLLDLISINDNDDFKRNLKLAMDELTSKERMIIELRYFDGLTQSEVAKRLFVSQVQVSRIENKILDKLKILI